ncbi:hypothetical protein PENTCL1PPCAC_9482, partial [Pristionchus entomophagus]
MHFCKSYNSMFNNDTDYFHDPFGQSDYVVLQHMHCISEWHNSTTYRKNFNSTRSTSASSLSTPCSLSSARRKIEHFLTLFNQCVEMEADDRVWRKLFAGFKMLLIAMNQVNKSRMALRLNDHFMRAADRIMERIGDWREHREDEGTTRLRSMLFIIMLGANSFDTIHKIYEESQMFLDEEDPRRRAVIFAYKMRGQDKQEDRKKEWESAGGADPRKEDPKLDKLIAKYGGWREHWIYALCSGRDPETAGRILRKSINGDYTPREILAGFRAAVEDFYDMRVGAREAFKVYGRLGRRGTVAVPDRIVALS